MKRGFYTIMSAQFFSSLADNALFVAAVEMLKGAGAPTWQRTALVPMFALFYVVLAPFLGAFSDAVPKGRVMFYSNAIKVAACLMMLWGSHPLIAYAFVGLGAAAYSPAKYGILTELLPTSQLVKANGWIEGLTILSVILGVGVGGQLIGPRISPYLLSFDVPFIDLGIRTPAQATVAFMVLLYAIAAAFNLRIPRTDAVLEPFGGRVTELVRDFSQCNARLWDDKLGQISLATTTLFWGASANLRYLVLAWAGAALAYDTPRATFLLLLVGLGTAAGAMVASMTVRLVHATHVILLGAALGAAVIAINGMHSVWVAGPFLIVLGAIGGFMVVPMNALLQHRGHNLMGSGRSIAVQNFNEQAAILGLGAFYSALTRGGLSVFVSIGVFGGLVAFASWLIWRWHKRNLVEHREEVEGLLAIARSDDH
ncbi:MAG: lysophospholipid transporter LplT [Burkholderiaceae bacterium]|nr:lysophospholipid transporter LplT [Burkholderiales bacterium]